MYSDGTETRAVVEYNGKPYFRRDLIQTETEDGEIVAETEYKAGQRVFPAVYGHKMGIVGETIDAFLSGDGSQWLILIEAVLRDNEGEPIIGPYGDEIVMSGLFLESTLDPIEECGVVSFRPGHSINVNELLTARDTRKLVGFGTYHRVRDREVFGPTPPRAIPAFNESGPLDDDYLVSESRDVDEETWRLVSEYCDQPLTMRDPEWTEKLQAVCHIFGWLHQRGRALQQREG
jgi:hypothetical protein